MKYNVTFGNPSNKERFTETRETDNKDNLLHELHSESVNKDLDLIAVEGIPEK